MNRACRTFSSVGAACAIVSPAAAVRIPPHRAARRQAAAFRRHPPPRRMLRCKRPYSKTSTHYLKARGQAEHISAVSFSLSRAGDPEILTSPPEPTRMAEAAARSRRRVCSKSAASPIVHVRDDPASRCGGQLDLDDTVGKWLPQYPAWKDVTIRRLLDMTSGIETYDNNQRFQRAFAKDPMHFFSGARARLVRLSCAGAPAGLREGLVLFQHRIHSFADDRAARERLAFDDLVRDQLIAREHLTNSFFEINMYPPTVRSRMVAGYFASHDAINAGLQPLYGKSVRDLSVSWLQGAGGIVGTPEDVTHWVRALFEGPLLARQQRADMERIVSLATANRSRARRPRIRADLAWASRK